MADLEIVFTDAYRVPGNTGAMIVDLVFKNNTPNYIKFYSYIRCGTTTRTFGIICVPSFTTSGYYLFRSPSFQYCPTSSTLDFRLCTENTPCPTISGGCVALSGVRIAGTAPIPRVVTTIPTTTEVLANLSNITATNITPSKTTCQELCSLTVDITWTNNGGSSGSFIPMLQVNTDPPVTSPPGNTVILAPLGTYTTTFIVEGLVQGSFVICPVPN